MKQLKAQSRPRAYAKLDESDSIAVQLTRGVPQSNVKPDIKTALSTVEAIALAQLPQDIVKRTSEVPSIGTTESITHFCISIHDIIAKTPLQAPGIRRLHNGGVEGVPRISGEHVKNALRGAGFTSLLQLLPYTDSPAIFGLDNSGRQCISHRRLSDFLSIQAQQFRKFGLEPNDRCGVTVPNGPELAVCLLACLSSCTCVPINSHQTPAETLSELGKVRAKAIIFQAGADLAGALSAASELGLMALELVPSASEYGIFSLRIHSDFSTVKRESTLSARAHQLAGSATIHSEQEDTYTRIVQVAIGKGTLGDRRSRGRPSVLTSVKYPEYLDSTGPEDWALMLFTSGTSGSKRAVPYTLESLCTGAACVAAAWGLHSTDCCLNMMPLHHVGGIVRNLTAPLFAGGAVACATSFDASHFWDTVSIPPGSHGRMTATWYYAGPTMHQMILEEARERANASCLSAGIFVSKGRGQLAVSASGGCCRIRFVANAAGGLAPSLAAEIQDLFGCSVLPSYGMTECMPISSPPPSYDLSRPGTSGLIVGPALRIYSGEGGSIEVGGAQPRPMEAGEVGRICIRGCPVMKGYFEDKDADARAFLHLTHDENEGHWFDTGDMGYMDSEGWLYITGRSKEVINRGGEIISPFEVEESLRTNPRIKEVIAFAAPHELFQEVVGVGIVPAQGRPRIDLARLQHYVSSRLHPAKWPQVLVYFDTLPRVAGGTGKLQRIRLADRLRLPLLSEADLPGARLFEAECAPLSSGLHGHMPAKPVLPLSAVEIEAAMASISAAYEVETAMATLGKCPWNPDAIVLYVTPSTVNTSNVVEALRKSLDDYSMPVAIMAIDKFPDNIASLPTALPSGLLSQGGIGDGLEAAGAQCEYVAPRTATEVVICREWVEVLGGPDPSVHADFFESGGNSHLAGRLTSRLRKATGAALTAAAVFSSRTPRALAALTDQILSIPISPVQSPVGNASGHVKSCNGCILLASSNTVTLNGAGCTIESAVKTDRLSSNRRPGGQTRTQAKMLLKQEWMPPARGSESLVVLCVQAIPLFLWYPLRKLASWIIFVAILMHVNGIWGWHKVETFLLSLALANVVGGALLPLIGIAGKWLIIGRYKEGRYPLWGQYYLRWWLVDQLLMVCGKGIFGGFGQLLRIYYQLLGAHISEGASVDRHATIGEYDLVSVGAGAKVDDVVLRAFCFEAGGMALRRVIIGNGCMVCTKAIVVPGIPIPDGAALGPLSSSYNLDANSPGSQEETERVATARLSCAGGFPKPGWLPYVLGCGVLLLVSIFAHLPSLLILQQLIQASRGGRNILEVTSSGTMADVTLDSFVPLLEWFITPSRLVFFIFLRLSNALATPVLRLLGAMAVKRFVVGKFTPGPRGNTEWEIFRHWITAELLPAGTLRTVAHLIGSHYEGVSAVMRMLGARVGKRIYWPGSMFEKLVQYDLLEIGDDVIFGSRSVLMCADRDIAAPIKISDGANVSDRCVFMPGVSVGRNAVVGSGGLGPRNYKFSPGSKSVGSRNGTPVVLHPGDTDVAQADTTRPYGRAMWHGKATYWVWPWFFHGAIFIGFQILVVTLRALTLAVSLSITFQLCRFQIDAVNASESAAMANSAGDSAVVVSAKNTNLWEFSKYAVPVFVLVHNASTILSIVGALAVKWACLSRRTPGDYDWDKSSYCQRWQVTLAANAAFLRHGVGSGSGLLDHLRGSAYLVWYLRALGSRIGRNVCMHPTGADPLMTEPELVSVGDESCIDDAALTAHLNTSGNFSLGLVEVGSRATLRRASRVLAGASVGNGAILLEHTLALPGDTVDPATVWQGWPASVVANPPLLSEQNLTLK